MNKIVVKGKINVFPKSRARLTKKKKPFEEQTIVVDISNDLGRLYSQMLYKETGILLEPPPFGCHVTLNNGLIPFNVEKHADYLKSLHGKSIQIAIEVDMYRHWEFYALPVCGKELNKIRKKLGLTEKNDYHITIGRIHPSIKGPGLLTKVLK